MKNPPFKDDFPIETFTYMGFPFAMFVYQMVYETTSMTLRDAPGGPRNLGIQGHFPIFVEVQVGKLPSACGKVMTATESPWNLLKHVLAKWPSLAGLYLPIPFYSTWNSPGWWFFNLPLWKRWVSWDDCIPCIYIYIHIWKNMFQSTRVGYSWYM